jgi:putative transposase
MLSQNEFEDWCYQLNTQEVARKIIEVERSSPPSRRVKGQGSYRGFYTSTKMGGTKDFESGNEYAQIRKKLEPDKSVLEYYSQPRPIGLEYLDRNGRRHPVQHTPDFFVLWVDRAGYVEVKTEEKLLVLAEQSPNRYIKREDGSWSCPPGETYASARGLVYELWSDADVSPILIRNIEWLEDYFTDPPPSIDTKIAKQILALVESELGIVYTEVLNAFDAINPDYLNILIVTEQLYIDLEAAPLGTPDRVHLFLNETMALAYEQTKQVKPIPAPEGFQLIQIDVGSSISWDGQPWKVLNLGERKISLINEAGKVEDIPNQEFDKYIENGAIIVANQLEPAASREGLEILLKARPEDHQKAQERLESIRPWLGDDPPPYPSRSIRRWRDAFLEGEELYGNGYIKLLPQQAGKNSQPRIDNAVTEFTHEFLKEHHEDPRGRMPKGLYRQFKKKCATHEPPFNAPSEKWFRLQIKKRSGFAQTLAREGVRAANQQKLFKAGIGVPKNSELPWNDVQIDHTQLPIQCIASLLSLDTCNTSSAIRLNDIVLGRPWVSMAISSSARRILALYLSYEEPCVRSVLMLLRILVQRYRRLPRRLTVDSGSEFEGIDFNTLLAFYRCDKRFRPAGEPKYGAPIERVFQTTQDLFIYDLLGQTRLMVNPRMVSKSVNPENLACWTLMEILKGLEKWAYEIYDNRPHSSLGATPRQAYEMGIALGGPREIRRLDYGDETFKILTMPSPKHGETRIVQPNGRGVKIDHFYYWCSAFDNPEIMGTRVRVKVEPFHPGIARSLVQGRWQECISPHTHFLNGYTSRELQIIGDELRERKRLRGEKVELSDKEIVEFLESNQALEGELLQDRMRALENKAAVDHFEGKEPSYKPYSSNQSVSDSPQTDSSQDSESQEAVEDEDEPDDFEYYGAF